MIPSDSNVVATGRNIGALNGFMRVAPQGAPRPHSVLFSVAGLDPAIHVFQPTGARTTTWTRGSILREGVFFWCDLTSASKPVRGCAPSGDGNAAVATRRRDR